MHSNDHSTAAAKQTKMYVLALSQFFDQLDHIADANQSLHSLAHMVSTAGQNQAPPPEQLANLIDCVAETIAARIDALREAIELRRLALDSAVD